MTAEAFKLLCAFCFIFAIVILFMTFATDSETDRIKLWCRNNNLEKIKVRRAWFTVGPFYCVDKITERVFIVKAVDTKTQLSKMIWLRCNDSGVVDYYEQP